MQPRSILTYGFAVFAMFFGSGNLVFPLEIGSSSGANWLLGFLGLLFTGILLPFLGLFVIKLNQGNIYTFFDGAGKFAGTILPFFILSLLGSFGVVPRCITVAHGGLSYLFPGMSLFAFSIIFCLATYFLCLKDHTMISILGKWMSPILLIALLLLIAIGIINAPIAITTLNFNDAFLNGFLTGYQTMDLFAAFFFSALIFKQIQQALPKDASNREILKFALLPSIIGSTLLGIVYLGFVFLGSHYQPLISGTDPELMLPTIVMSLMGSSATALIAIAIIFSCLSTAVALNNIYARYLCSTFSLKDNKFPILLFLSTAISFIISLLDFKGIAAFLAPVLDVSYPGLIALTIVSIVSPANRKAHFLIFWIITLIMVAYSINNILRTI